MGNKSIVTRNFNVSGKSLRKHIIYIFSLVESSDFLSVFTNPSLDYHKKLTKDLIHR